VIPLSGRESSAEILSVAKELLFRITEDARSDVTLAASLREGAGCGMLSAHEQHTSAGGSSVLDFAFLAMEGRYQNGCRYHLRYQLSVDSKAVRRKGSEVATSDHVF